MGLDEHKVTWTMAGISVALIVAFIVVPNLLHHGIAPTSSGLGGPPMGLNAICTANVSYQYAHPKEGFATKLEDLGPKGAWYIDSTLASGEKSGYRYEYSAHADASGRIEHYTVVMKPLKSATGNTNYYSDESCEVHWTKEDRAATKADPILK